MWTAAELGLAVDRRDVGLNFGGTDTPEYLAMNPNGLVPTLQDDHVTLFESAAVVRYLAARHGRFPFWPEDPIARAPVDMWAEWGKATLQPSFLRPVFWPTLDGKAARREGPRPLREEPRHPRVPPRAARGSSAPTSPSPTSRSASPLYRYFTCDLETRRDRPAVAAYYARLAERPAYAEHVMVNYDVLKTYTP